MLNFYRFAANAEPLYGTILIHCWPIASMYNALSYIAPQQAPPKTLYCQMVCHYRPCLQAYHLPILTPSRTYHQMFVRTCWSTWEPTQHTCTSISSGYAHITTQTPEIRASNRIKSCSWMDTDRILSYQISKNVCGLKSICYCRLSTSRRWNVIRWSIIRCVNCFLHYWTRPW